MRRENKLKPNAIIHYNLGKGLIDVSDQLSSYHSYLREGVKWYRKIALDIICNTAFVNALSRFKSITNNNIAITQLREEISLNMIKKKVNLQQTTSHILVIDNYTLCCKEESKKCNIQVNIYN